MTPPDTKVRVAITGIGLITPLGCTLEGNWNAMLSGVSGIRSISRFDPQDLPCTIGGEIPDFDPTTYMSSKDARRMSRASQIMLAASKLAIEDAHLTVPFTSPERAGVYVGTAAGGVIRLDEGIQTLRTRGFSRVNPFTAPAVLPNMLTFHVTEYAGAVGPNCTITTACASGTQSVGEAFHLIQGGRADLVVAGGAEALISDFVIAGFAAMRALPTGFNDQPSKASRPFDALRDGFVLSEGAACLILERLDLALERGARPYAEIMGYASSNDAYHMAAPHPEAAGAIRTMQWALADANLSPDGIDYINAHGTSTPSNDAAESNAIKAVFGERAYRIPISSTKSMIGHPMGASGTIEAAVCALTIDNDQIPPTINYEVPDPACDLDYVPNQSRQVHVDTALTNSFGLGGQNACLVIKGVHNP
ncbi:MAG: beta-ketoacyl-ACP synthase II [Anaerolineales bacterium]